MSVSHKFVLCSNSVSGTMRVFWNWRMESKMLPSIINEESGIHLSAEFLALSYNDEGQLTIGTAVMRDGRIEWITEKTVVTEREYPQLFARFIEPW